MRAFAIALLFCITTIYVERTRDCPHILSCQLATISVGFLTYVCVRSVLVLKCKCEVYSITLEKKAYYWF